MGWFHRARHLIVRCSLACRGFRGLPHGWGILGPRNGGILGGGRLTWEARQLRWHRVRPIQKYGGMESLPAASEATMASPRRPRGRPPSDCVWAGAGYVNIASGEPHRAADSRERFLQWRRRYDKARYWDAAKTVRKERLARSARKRGRSPRPIQLRLDQLAVAGLRSESVTFSAQGQ